MKFKIWAIIYILVLSLLFGCQNSQSIEGNYSICHNGYYREVYFKNDSMRVASDNEWTKLSKWKKIKIKNDTIHFETFGEWRDFSKVVIKYVGKNKIKLRNLKSGENLDLEQIDENLNFEKQHEFWKGFYNRQSSGNCK
jgi:hypothetical protein